MINLKQLLLKLINTNQPIARKVTQSKVISLIDSPITFTCTSVNSIGYIYSERLPEICVLDQDITITVSVTCNGYTSTFTGTYTVGETDPYTIDTSITGSSNTYKLLVDPSYYSNEANDIYIDFDLALAPYSSTVVTETITINSATLTLDQYWEYYPESKANRAYPPGSLYLTTTNTNPSTTLGGNWKLVESVSEPYFYRHNTANADNDVLTWNTTNVWKGADYPNWVVYTLLEGQLFLSFGIYPKVAVSDSSLTWFSINQSDTGRLSTSYAYYGGFCHGDNKGVIGTGNVQAASATSHDFATNIKKSYSADTAHKLEGSVIMRGYSGEQYRNRWHWVRYF